MKTLLALVLLISTAMPGAAAETAPAEREAGGRLVYVIPVRENIMPPLVYLVRRGVKDAIEKQADLLILDMNTNGGRLDVTEEIVGILGQFKGQTATLVNDRAYSAGAFIAAATEEIYMHPMGVIGAAAPVFMTPGGGVQDAPSTMEIKMTSAVRAMVRRTAEMNGHDPDVFEAMIDRNKVLVMDGEVIKEEGDILTLTATEALREYGDPPRPLLSAGTVETLDELVERLGYAGAARIHLEPTGVERLATWINTISPILLMIGILGIYIEMKTPGFGIPGLLGVGAFILYFFGSYVGGFSGIEWVLLFFLGLALILIELFFVPGIIVLGLSGSVLVLISLVMAAVDMYPDDPVLPSLPQLRVPLQDMFIALLGSALVIWLLSLWLPRTALFHALVSSSVSGEGAVNLEADEATRIGQVGCALSDLRPGGKAQFGDRILDVVSPGEMIERGTRVRIVRQTGRAEALVEPVDPVD